MIRISILILIVAIPFCQTAAQESNQALSLEQRFGATVDEVLELEAESNRLWNMCEPYMIKAKKAMNCLKEITEQKKMLKEVFGSMAHVPDHLQPRCRGYYSPYPLDDFNYYGKLVEHCHKKTEALLPKATDAECRCGRLRRELVAAGKAEVRLP